MIAKVLIVLALVLTIIIVMISQQQPKKISREQLMSMALVPIIAEINNSGKFPARSIQLKTQVARSVWKSQLTKAVYDNEFTFEYEPADDAGSFRIIIKDNVSNAKLAFTEFLGKTRESWAVSQEYVSELDSRLIPNFWNEATWVMYFVVSTNRERIWQPLPNTSFSKWAKTQLPDLGTLIKKSNWEGATIRIQDDKGMVAIITNLKGEVTQYPLSFKSLPKKVK